VGPQRAGGGGARDDPTRPREAGRAGGGAARRTRADPVGLPQPAGWSSPAQEARHYFGLPPDAAVEDFRPIVERYPVFRVTTPPGETPAREEDAHATHP
jgi:hypothetical protein